jgi:hypothetical protein
MSTISKISAEMSAIINLQEKNSCEKVNALVEGFEATVDGGSGEDFTPFIEGTFLEFLKRFAKDLDRNKQFSVLQASRDLGQVLAPFKGTKYRSECR